MSDLDYAVHVQTLAGQDKDLTEYRGKVLLIVNTASRCGFTPQYAGLQALQDRYREKGLVILGFPCDQFGHQEPGANDEIASFCRINYGVTFPMHARIKVNGTDAHPLYKQLKSARKGLLGSATIKWNFTKFLVDREGRIVERFAPAVKPEDLVAHVEGLLG